MARAELRICTRNAINAPIARTKLNGHVQSTVPIHNLGGCPSIISQNAGDIMAKMTPSMKYFKELHAKSAKIRNYEHRMQSNKSYLNTFRAFGARCLAAASTDAVRMAMACWRDGGRWWWQQRHRLVAIETTQRQQRKNGNKMNAERWLVPPTFRTAVQ